MKAKVVALRDHFNAKAIEADAHQDTAAAAAFFFCAAEIERRFRIPRVSIPSPAPAYDADKAFEAQFEDVPLPAACSCSRGGRAIFCDCREAR